MKDGNEKIDRRIGCQGQSYSRKYPFDDSHRAQRILDASLAEGSKGGVAVEGRLVGRNEVQGRRPAPLVEEWARDEAPPQVERGEVAVQRRSVERGEDAGREESSV